MGQTMRPEEKSKITRVNIGIIREGEIVSGHGGNRRHNAPLG